ncbi:MAG: hypothetical protein SF162_11735 [bacterium]|nr:hypothetical protein [bacterium]
MIDQMDRELQAWVSTVTALDDDRILFTPPGADVGARGTSVSVYLLHVVRVMTAHELPRAAPTPSKIMLHYLVTVADADPFQGHRLLGQLIFAALEEADYEVDLEPLPLEAWTAFQQAPRPGFILKVPLRRERPERIPRLVTQPLDVRAVQTTDLHGIVLGPGDTPLHGAVVELPGLHLSQRTTRTGTFLFPLIPATAQKRILRIRAKGKLIEHAVEQSGTAADPVIVRVAFES